MPVYASSEDHYAERCIVAEGVDLTSGDVDDIFTVVGGPVLCIGLFVEITTAVSNNACNINFESDPTTGAANTDITAGGAPDIALAAIGDWFSMDGDSADVMLKHANGTSLPMITDNNGGIVIPEGGVDMKLSAATPTTGIGNVYMRYKPLTSAARVTT
jgi:hypothetical protein